MKDLTHIAQTHYMKNPSLLDGEVLDSKLLYLPKNDTFYSLNRSAYLIWFLLERQGAFGTASRESSFKIFEDWFNNPPARESISKDINLFISELISNKLLIEKPQEIDLHYVACPVHESNNKYDYEKPSITVYDSEWMRDNHPYYFHTITYSDIWNPSSPS